MTDAKETTPRRRAEKIAAVIDRVEDGDIAVILLENEAQTQLDIHVSHLPEAAREAGDHLLLTLIIEGDGHTRTLKKIAPAPERRAQTEARVKKLQARLARLGDAAGKKDFKL